MHQFVQTGGITKNLFGAIIAWRYCLTHQRSHWCKGMLGECRPRGGCATLSIDNQTYSLCIRFNPNPIHVLDNRSNKVNQSKNFKFSYDRNIDPNKCYISLWFTIMVSKYCNYFRNFSALRKIIYFMSMLENFNS